MCRALWLAGLMCVLSMAGCLSPQTRMQSAEEIERDKDLEAVRTIGDVTDVANAGGLQVSAVGLVTDLEGTGGSPRGEWRTLLEKELRQQKIENVSRLLDSPNNALVQVTGIIAAGSRKHDLIDIQVSLPQGSPATSLRGGYLHPCVLRNTETTKNLDPDYKGGNRLLQGHKLAVAKGPLLVGFGNPNEPAALKSGRIWEGAVSMIERPFFLVLKKDDKSAKVANAVAARINLKYPDDAKRQEFVQAHRQLFLLDDVTSQIDDTFKPSGGKSGEVAKASQDYVNVRVPYAYRYNPERYLRVARLIPFSDNPEQANKYRRRLSKMLQDPHDCVRAALRLEAIGKDSIPALQQGLTSPVPLVRFAAAEALTYLGSTSGVEELVKLATTQPQMSAYALIALAGLNEAICRNKLQDLLASDHADLRAGAFQTLRLPFGEEFRIQELQCRSEKERDEVTRRFDENMRRYLGGENLQAFWLHQVAVQGAPVVNFAVTKRAEIILFGQDIRLVAPVKVRAGEEFIITAEPGDEKCFVSRINQRDEKRLSCSLRLADVLRKLADLGGQYPEAVELLRKLDEQQGLTCPVRLLSPPQATPLEELLAESRSERNKQVPNGE